MNTNNSFYFILYLEMETCPFKNKNSLKMLLFLLTLLPYSSVTISPVCNMPYNMLYNFIYNKFQKNASKIGILQIIKYISKYIFEIIF